MKARQYKIDIKYVEQFTNPFDFVYGPWYEIQIGPHNFTIDDKKSKLNKKRSFTKSKEN